MHVSLRDSLLTTYHSPSGPELISTYAEFSVHPGKHCKKEFDYSMESVSNIHLLVELSNSKSTDACDSIKNGGL